MLASEHFLQKQKTTNIEMWFTHPLISHVAGVIACGIIVAKAQPWLIEGFFPWHVTFMALSFLIFMPQVCLNVV